jgi:glutamate N-acetyltransferase / amino-acid N-acetyltransferase
MADWQEISGGVTAPKGFKAGGIKAGLKPSGAPDLALIVSDVDAIAAGVFTTSQVRAAPVDYCRQTLSRWRGRFSVTPDKPMPRRVLRE